MKREWIVFLVSVLLFLLLWPALSTPRARSCVWIDTSYTTTRSLKSDQGIRAVCIPEAQIRDAGCDPRYQDCAAVFYVDRGDRVRLNTGPVTSDGGGYTAPASASGVWYRTYHQTRPWYGTHRPLLWGERSEWGNLWTTPMRILAGVLP